MRSTVATLLVVVLVALAGCGSTSQVATTVPEAGATTDASPGTTSDEPTTTSSEPTERTTTATATTTSQDSAATVDGDLPPGVNATGDVNGSALWEAHMANTLDADGYRHVVTFTNRTGEFRRVTFQSVTNLTDARAVVETSDGTSRSWYTDRGNVSATWNESGRQYYDHANAVAAVGPVFAVVEAEAYPLVLLNRGTFEVAGTVERDGRSLLELQATGVGERELVRILGNPPLDEPYSDMTGTVLVTREGTIVSMNLSLYDESGSDPTVTVTFDGDGTPGEVEPPEWVDERAILSVSGSEWDDDGNPRLVVVENAGDAAVPSGTNLSIGNGWREVDAVTLDESLEPGEKAYLYVVGDTLSDGDVRLARESGPSLPPEALAFSSEPVVHVETGNVTAAYGFTNDGPIINATSRRSARAQSSNERTVS